MISYEEICQALDRHNATRRNEAELADLNQAGEPPAEAQGLDEPGVDAAAAAATTQPFEEPQQPSVVVGDPSTPDPDAPPAGEEPAPEAAASMGESPLLGGPTDEQPIDEPPKEDTQEIDVDDVMIDEKASQGDIVSD